MNILALIKQVPDDSIQVHLNAESMPDTEKIRKTANVYDTYAVEMAVRCCEKNGGQLTVLAVGDPDQENMLKSLLAVGAEKAYLFSDPAFEHADEAVLAEVLVNAAKKCEKENGVPFDLILCGKESTDEADSQIAARIAEILKVGFVSSVVEFELNGNMLTAKQETDEGYNKYETAVPAVFSIAKPDYEPRYPNIRAKMAARKAVVPVFSAQDIQSETIAPVVRCNAYRQPEKRSGGRLICEADLEELMKRTMAALTEDKVL